jgi:tetrapyrrole methylase family protein / MazG family protein
MFPSMPKAPPNLRDFQGLLKIVEHLRGPEGCPWDKEQTHNSLTRFAIEEAFELGEAIDSGDQKAIRDELGDLLLQVVLHSEIARQEQRFDVYDVIQNISEKMVRRHPHVFEGIDGEAPSKAKSSDEVLDNWAKIKAKEKGHKDPFDIPKALPALLRAHKIGEKTKKVAFDWETPDQCWTKVSEELGELKQATKENNRNEIEAELGDLLFSLSQWARHMGLDSEQALRKTNLSFESRFKKMQELVKTAGLSWDTLPADQKEKYWKQAKTKE